MISQEFEYSAPETLQEALSLISEGAKPMAGGMSLVPLMKLRLAAPEHLVDIARVPGLNYIRAESDGIHIGATTTHYDMEISPVLRGKCPLLAETASHIGDVQVRNVGTIGGSIAHADPAADWPAVVLARGAEFRATGPKGARTIKAEDFFKDVMTTALGPDEVLTEIRIPALASGSGTAYVKHPHPASRFAVVGVAAILTVSGGTCQKASVAVTGVGPKASRAKGVEAALQGKSLDAQTIAAAAQKAADGIEMSADLQGSVEYKQHLTRVYVKRALEAAAGRVR
jgi:carbon-monoxide dehydrogenase medium subunit